jgi:uncharacterized membrane protein HdeD (DUF308 family)
MLTPSKTLIFPILGGVLYAIVCGFFLVTVNGFRGKEAVVLIGGLTLAAGACTVAAAFWNSLRRPSWALAVSGLFCGALGWMIAFWKGPVAFRTIAVLIAGMAIGLGLHEFQSLRVSQRQAFEAWLSGAAAVVSLGFAVVFLGFVLRWIPLEPSPSAQTFLWLGAFFGFSAICMVKMALRPGWPALPASQQPIAH